MKTYYIKNIIKAGNNVKTKNQKILEDINEKVAEEYGDTSHRRFHDYN